MQLDTTKGHAPHCTISYPVSNGFFNFFFFCKKKHFLLPQTLEINCLDRKENSEGKWMPRVKFVEQTTPTSCG